MAGLTSRSSAAADWARKEKAVKGDFSRNDTLADLSAALGLTGTELNRLKTVISTSSGVFVGEGKSEIKILATFFPIPGPQRSPLSSAGLSASCWTH